MNTYIIFVNDNGELKTITEQEMIDTMEAGCSNAHIDVQWAIDYVLDKRSKKEQDDDD